MEELTLQWRSLTDIIRLGGSRVIEHERESGGWGLDACTAQRRRSFKFKSWRHPH